MSCAKHEKMTWVLFFSASSTDRPWITPTSYYHVYTNSTQLSPRPVPQNTPCLSPHPLVSPSAEMAPAQPTKSTAALQPHHTTLVVLQAHRVHNSTTSTVVRPLRIAHQRYLKSLDALMLPGPSTITTDTFAARLAKSDTMLHAPSATAAPTRDHLRQELNCWLSCRRVSVSTSPIDTIKGSFCK